MALPVNADDVIATINYEGISIVSALQHENIMGIQFHPELSGPAGLRILETFLAM
jgi:glutamine amidotransferase